ncbi:methyltransferase domain-containing protein [Azorhizobium doebereinerae]|uniref:methyltransferase domain-containing protein n=1 Tax=Azorhizobium doebereinerae TaxID=281091 RepID=UPI00048B53CE|nr:methyltransferase domain-containing protein [Azorhizobium doebereinerae]
MREYPAILDESAALRTIIRTMGGPSQEVISIGGILRGSLPGFRTLDLGSGAGRNSIFLAGIGSRVTAVDASAAHIGAMARLAQGARLDIEAVCGRVEQFQLLHQYDLVLCHGILHFLDRSTALSTVSKLKVNTAQGGIHLITIAKFDSSDDIPRSFVEQGHPNTLTANNLLRAYEDWSCVAHERYVKRDHHPGGGYHLHPIDKLAFQRPGGEHRTLLGEAHLLNDDDRKEVQTFLSTDELILTSKDAALEELGPPDLSFTYNARGQQLSFQGISGQGYELSLLFWSKYAAYFENGLLVGFSTYRSDRFHTFRLSGSEGLG